MELGASQASPTAVVRLLSGGGQLLAAGVWLGYETSSSNLPRWVGIFLTEDAMIE